jgi:hypothetical protein
MLFRRPNGSTGHVFSSDVDRSRRVLAAFLLGSAISVAGIAATVANRASAHGPFTAANPIPYTQERFQPSRPTYSVVNFESKPSREPEKRRRIQVIAGRGESAPFSYSGSQPVCVRLCDGYFFPLPVAANGVGAQTAACNSLCPDAPTEVFYRNGGDKIETAISAHGQLYTSLPVSLRYRGTSDNTCSCHRDVVAYAPLKDSTLRRGDAVMTPAGFMVFRGTEGAPHGAKDFTALSGAGLPTQARTTLQAMEKVSVAPVHPTLQDWLFSQANPPARTAAGDDKIRLVTKLSAQD